MVKPEHLSRPYLPQHHPKSNSFNLIIQQTFCWFTALPNCHHPLLLVSGLCSIRNNEIPYVGWPGFIVLLPSFYLISFFNSPQAFPKGKRKSFKGGKALYWEQQKRSLQIQCKTRHMCWFFKADWQWKMYELPLSFQCMLWCLHYWLLLPFNLPSLSSLGFLYYCIASPLFAQTSWSEAK